MAASPTIWGEEPAPGAERGTMRARLGDVEWRAVTTLENGSVEWRSSETVQVVRREEGSRQMFGKKWPRSSPDGPLWPDRPEWGRGQALKAGRWVEKKKAHAKEREAINQKEMTLRRLMGTTMKRVGRAINQVVAGEKALVGPGMRSTTPGKRPRRKKAVVMREKIMRARMVTTKELRAAFKEFLVDAKKDKELKKPNEYRQWLWTDRNAVYLAPAGRRTSGGQGRVAG